MELKEIFKDDIELLDNKSVLKLIEHVKDHNKKILCLFDKYKDLHDSILDELVSSEIMIIDGKRSKDTLIRIAELINEV